MNWNVIQVFSVHVVLLVDIHFNCSQHNIAAMYWNID
jgi:hypothetical protein